jgi:uncharacterized membrane protein
MDDFKITMVFFEFVWVLVVISASQSVIKFSTSSPHHKRRTAESSHCFSAINNGRELIMTIFEQISFLVQGMCTFKYFLPFYRPEIHVHEKSIPVFVETLVLFQYHVTKRSNPVRIWTNIVYNFVCGKIVFVV